MSGLLSQTSQALVWCGCGAGVCADECRGLQGPVPSQFRLCIGSLEQVTFHPCQA